MGTDGNLMGHKHVSMSNEKLMKGQKQLGAPPHCLPNGLESQGHRYPHVGFVLRNGQTWAFCFLARLPIDSSLLQAMHDHSSSSSLENASLLLEN